jgi:hypothetical protein
MPTLLWRVLHSVGYQEGKEPRYYWSKEQLGDRTMVYVEAIIPPRGDDPNWGGWFFGSKGRNPWEGANRASFAALKDIMNSSPEILARALVGVFPRGDPYTSVWSQPKGMALTGGVEEGQGSDNPAMSAMFAMMKTYACLERSFGRLEEAFLVTCDEKRQVRREYEEEIERITGELTRMTLQRDQATHKEDVAMQDILALRDQLERMTLAHRNCEHMLVHVLNQRNEAWNEENVLRARQLELEQQLAAAEEYNGNLHEEVHQLHNQLHPFPGAAEAGDDDDGNASEMDSDHDE